MTEEESLRENQVCASCKKFSWYMGSAGICEAKAGCVCKRMIDCMDSCDCGKYEFNSIV